jgi:hypothetical protein
MPPYLEIKEFTAVITLLRPLCATIADTSPIRTRMEPVRQNNLTPIQTYSSVRPFLF